MLALGFLVLLLALLTIREARRRGPWAVLVVVTAAAAGIVVLVWRLG